AGPINDERPERRLRAWKCRTDRQLVLCHLRGSPTGVGPSDEVRAPHRPAVSGFSRQRYDATYEPTNRRTRVVRSVTSGDPTGLVRFYRTVTSAAVICCNGSVDPKLHSLATILDRADSRLRSPDSSVRIWPTGFPLIDDVL